MKLFILLAFLLVTVRAYSATCQSHQSLITYFTKNNWKVEKNVSSWKGHNIQLNSDNLLDKIMILKKGDTNLLIFYIACPNGKFLEVGRNSHILTNETINDGAGVEEAKTHLETFDGKTFHVNYRTLLDNNNWESGIRAFFTYIDGDKGMYLTKHEHHSITFSYDECMINSYSTDTYDFIAMKRTVYSKDKDYTASECQPKEVQTETKLCHNKLLGSVWLKLSDVKSVIDYYNTFNSKKYECK